MTEPIQVGPGKLSEADGCIMLSTVYPKDIYKLSFVDSPSLRTLAEAWLGNWCVAVGTTASIGTEKVVVVQELCFTEMPPS